MTEIEETTTQTATVSAEEQNLPDASGKLDSTDGGARRRPPQRESRCHFCRDKVTRVDYKDTVTLEGCLRPQGRIRSGKRSGTCSRHQRMVKRAIKQARYLALLSFTDSPRGVMTGRRSFR